jgi:hypothetical protein
MKIGNMSAAHIDLARDIKNLPPPAAIHQAPEMSMPSNRYLNSYRTRCYIYVCIAVGATATGKEQLDITVYRWQLGAATTVYP